MACAASNFASGSVLSPAYPIRPLVIRPPVAGAQTMSWHTTVASLVLSTASAKASRRFLAAAPAGVEQVSSIALVCGGQRNGPAAGRLAACTRVKATHVVRTFGGDNNCRSSLAV